MEATANDVDVDAGCKPEACYGVHDRKRETEREGEREREVATSVLGIRVLFSLHFSCITSMAIVYVNFDVSAKVVKCEVLDVLIALCRNQLRAGYRCTESKSPKLPP